MKQRMRQMGARGFTLIEVLVAVVLLGVISFLLWESMGGAISSKDRSERREQTYRGADVVLNRLTRELSMGVLYSSIEFLGISSSAEQMTKSVLIGENGGDQDKLTFDSFSHIRYLKDSKESDLAEVTYFLDKSDSEEALAGEFVLKIREKSPLDNDPGKGGRVMVLLEGVRELNFRYYDPVKNEYKDEWDTTKIDYSNRLPRAVEITLVLTDPIDEENTVRFQTVAMIEMSPGPNDF